MSELLELLPILKSAWKSNIDRLTGGTGIYPYDPSEMTPQDDGIYRDVRSSLFYSGETRKWVTPPRHTKEGWVPGVKVVDLYLESLNT